MKSAKMRVHPRRVLRIVLLAAMFVFVLLNLHILLTTETGGNFDSDFEQVLGLQGRHRQLGDAPHVQFQGEGGGSQEGEHERMTSQAGLVIPPASRSLNASAYAPLDTADIEAIKTQIRAINEQQHIRNIDRFGLKLKSDSVVMIVQVHDRAEHLKLLLKSLNKVRDIQNVLLVISHDVYSKALNDIVMEIDFCPVMQIFFPYSQQIYSTEFPGEDPKDCSRNMKKAEAQKAKCNNADHPDKYGHYREAKYCQAKHHWMWKLNHLFEHISVMKNYDGMVLLLEEDYYVSEDVLSVMQMMQNLMHKDCKDCKMLAVGNYDKTQNYQINSGKAEKAFWISSRHNMGMVFTRAFWEEVKKCHKEFCTHDDYNWDWTLQHLSMKCIPNKIRLLKLKATRVFHIGECGIHHKGKVCSPQDKVNKVEALLAANRKFLFPNVMAVAGESRFKLREPKANGGWGDKRDHDMCLSYFNTTSS